MKIAAPLLLTGALLWVSPARADFFDDLGFALNKLGDSVERGVKDITTDDAKSAPASQAGSQAPAPVAAAAPEASAETSPDAGGIIWNAAPAGVVTSEMARGVNTPPLPRSRPGASAPYEIRGSSIKDDAPAPSRAPTRRPVQMVASLAPIAGYSEAPALQRSNRYSPADAAARLQNVAPSAAGVTAVNVPIPPAKPAPRSSTQAAITPASLLAPAPVIEPPKETAMLAPIQPAAQPAALPPVVLPAKPAVTATARVVAPTVSAPAVTAPIVSVPAIEHNSTSAARNFTIKFSNRMVSVNDAVLRNTASKPDTRSQALIAQLVRQVKNQPGMRIKLESSAVAIDDRLGEARRRSFERAQLVQNWLVAQGVRTTQIDLNVLGASTSDVVSLSAYKAN